MTTEESEEDNINSLKESVHLYLTILNSMTEAVHIIDSYWHIIFINKQMEVWLESLGLSTVVSGRTLHEAFPLLTEKIHEEYRYVFKTGKTSLTEDILRLPDSEYHTEVQRIPIFNKGHVVKIVTIIRDLTKIQEAKAASILEKNKLQSLINSIEYGLTIQDRDYNIIFQNEYLNKKYGNPGEKCYRVYEFRENICEECPVELSFRDGMAHKAV